MKLKLIVLALASAALTNAQNSVDPKGRVTHMANPNLPSQISMIMLGVENVARSVAFYRDVVGLEVKSQSPEFAFLSTGSVTLALSLPLGQHVQPRVGALELIFPVESMSQSQSLLKERGCSFLNDPREVTPGQWAVNFKDPDGHYLTLLGSK